MSKKALAALTLGAGLLAFLAVLYMFYPQRPPQVGPATPEALKEVPYRTAPEFAGKPGVPAPGAPPVQEPPPSPEAKDSPAPSEKPLVELKPPAAPSEASPPTTPEEHFGILVGRYRTYKEASRVMEKVQKQGKPSFIQHDGRQRKPYAVWAGPFSSKEEAKESARAIGAKMKVTAKTEKLQMPIPK